MRQSTQRQLTHALASLFMVGSLVLQQGCGGGGGGGGSKPAKPALAMSVAAIKTFHFSWGDVSGETEYRLMEDPDGASGYSQVTTIAADATEHDLVISLPQRVNARYILQACNADGCTNSNDVPVTGNLVAGIGYMKAPDPKEAGFFGNSVALSADGNVLAVGPGGEKVYVFVKSNGQWGEPAILTAGDSTDGFGYKLALSGDGSILAAAAEYEAAGGGVYVFSNASGSWTPEEHLHSTDAAAGDGFGCSVSLSTDGTVLAAGASGKNAGAGAAYVFGKGDSGWGQRKKVTASNAASNDHFGESVALSGDGQLLAVGAPDEGGSGLGSSDDSPLRSGAVYLYSGSAWEQETYLKVANPTENAFLGYRVALSADGQTLAADAYGARAVYVYSHVGAQWAEGPSLTAPNGERDDYFGTSLALSSDGGVLAVGADGEKSRAIGLRGDEGDNTAIRSGAVYVFVKKGGSWSLPTYIKASNTAPEDGFGATIALSTGGETLVVGSPAESTVARASGAIYWY